jgi:hypothetical protein
MLSGFSIGTTPAADKHGEAADKGADGKRDEEKELDPQNHGGGDKTLPNELVQSAIGLRLHPQIVLRAVCSWPTAPPTPNRRMIPRNKVENMATL